MGNIKWLAIAALLMAVASIVATVEWGYGNPPVGRVLAMCAVALAVLSLHDRD